MVKQAKQAYLNAIRGRYTKAKRTDKARILDELARCAVTNDQSYVRLSLLEAVFEYN